MRRIVFVLLLMLPFICFSTVTKAHAQTTGITVHPSIVQLDLANDQPQTTLTYTNNTSQSILLTFSTSDVTELNDNYQLSFLDKKDAHNFKYGLSSWISFDSSSLLLNPHATGKLTVFITKDELSPGGHYGSILAEVQQANGSGNVSLKTIIATLIFVRANTGKEYEKANITTFAPEQTFFNFPQNFLLRFTNSGDTFLIPYGKVDIYDAFGQLIGRGTLNTGSLIVLPETLRRLEIPVSHFGGIVWPGMYHANLSLHFGKMNQQLTATTTFFTFGSFPIIFIGILLIITTLLIVKKLTIRKRKPQSLD